MSDYMYSVSRTQGITYSVYKTYAELSRNIELFYSKKQCLSHVDLLEENPDAIKVYERDWGPDSDRSLCIDMIQHDNDLDFPFSIYQFNVTDKNNIRLEKEFKYESYIETVRQLIHFVDIKYLSNPTAAEIHNFGGYYQFGAWNPIIIQTDGSIRDSRIEVMIIMGDKIYCLEEKWDDGHRFVLPKEPRRHHKTDFQCVETICNNTCRIKVNPDTIKQTGYCNNIDYEIPCPTGEGLQFKTVGACDSIYIAYYDGLFYGDVVGSEDYELTHNARFRYISEVYPLLSEQEQKALSVYVSKGDLSPTKRKVDDIIEAANNNDVATVDKLIIELESEIDSTTVDDCLTQNAVTTALTNMGNNNDFEQGLPEALPCFSPAEMDRLGVFNENPKDNFYKVLSSEDSRSWYESYCATGNPGLNWKDKVEKAYNEFTSNRSDFNKQRLLELGWNPEVPFTTVNLERASKITRQKLNESFAITTFNMV